MQLDPGERFIIHTPGVAVPPDAKRLVLANPDDVVANQSGAYGETVALFSAFVGQRVDLAGVEFDGSAYPLDRWSYAGSEHPFWEGPTQPTGLRFAPQQGRSYGRLPSARDRDDTSADWQVQDQTPARANTRSF